MKTLTSARLAEIREMTDKEMASHSVGSAPPFVLLARDLLYALDDEHVVCVHPRTEVVNEGYLPGVGRDIYRKCPDCGAIVESGYKPRAPA